MSTRSRITLSIAVAVAASSPVSGQARLNIDYDDAYGVPASSYAAAGMQNGTWNLVDFGATDFPLVDTTGNVTPVTVTRVGMFAPYSFNNSSTSGDDEALLDDVFDLGGVSGSGSLFVDGLPDGNYDVYVYAFAPDSATFLTDVTVAPSVDPLQTIGGTWSGGHAQGTTYGLFAVTIQGGTPLAVHYATNSGFGSINGLQFVSEGRTGFGTNYCTAEPNTVGPGSTIFAAGSTSVSAMSLQLCADGMPPSVSGIFFYGTMPTDEPFGAGRRCVAGALQRLPPDPANPSGVNCEDDVFAQPLNNVPLAVGTFYFQHWYRDPMGVGGPFNLSNGIAITFVP